MYPFSMDYITFRWIFLSNPTIPLPVDRLPCFLWKRLESVTGYSIFTAKSCKVESGEPQPFYDETQTF